MELCCFSFNEPLVEIHTPSSSGVTSQAIDTIKDEVLKAATNPEEQDGLTIDVDEIINMPTGSAALDSIIVANDPTSVQNSMISPIGVVDTGDEVVFDLSDDKTRTSDGNKSDNEALMNRISECIDNAQNMKIACTDSSVPPTRA